MNSKKKSEINKKKIFYLIKMEYLPSTLKVLHLGVAGLGLYVSVEGQDKIWPGRQAAGAPPFLPTWDFKSGFRKSTYITSAYIVTVVAFLQLAVLFYYHNYGGKESHFRLAYLVLALINLIFGSLVLVGAVSLLYIPPTNNTVESISGLPDGPEYDVAVAGAVLGALVIAFNFVNLYHAGHATVGPMRKGKLFSPSTMSYGKKKHSPRRR